MLPRVLYLTHRVPHPPDKGDRIRNWHVLRQLTRRFRVSLGCPADEPVQPSTRDALSELCESVAIVPVTRLQKWSRAGLSWLRGRSLSEGAFASRELAATTLRWHAEAPFHAAIVSATSLVPYLCGSRLRDVPSFVDVVDVDSQKWLDFAESAAFPKSWLYRREGQRIRVIEQDLPRWARGSVLVSQAEARIFESIAGSGTAFVATNGVDLNDFQPANTGHEPIAAFVGALDYLPNIDAAEWFVHAIWPAIRSRRSDAEFHVIGRNPVRRIRRLSGVPGVRLIGGVPDVRPHLARAQVAVVPMRLSRGLQNKVLEALAMGKAVVAAPPALAAIAAEHDRHLVRAETVDDWIREVLDLFENRERRSRLGRAGRDFVEANHCWDRCLEPLIDRVEKAVHRASEYAGAMP